jgi:hypothetical protein
MKKLAIALAVGAFISAALIIFESPTDYALLTLEWPGISAAYLYWGAIGGGSFTGVAIAWVVNALAYGAGAFAMLTVLRAARS